MDSRSRGNVSMYPPTNAPRQNEYFVPRDGIDREVITADICRYLGNDALVRPGTHKSDNGHIIQGYYITAYRNLTSAMIADLKNDSARWEAERRKHQSGAVRYQDSRIRDGPQRSGGGGGGPGNGAGYVVQNGYAGSRDFDSGPRYPGSEAPGYSASGPGGPGHYGASGGHGGFGGQSYTQGGPSQGGPYMRDQNSTPQDPRYGSPSTPMGGLAGAHGAISNGGGSTSAPLAQQSYSSGAHYVVAPSRDSYAMDMAMTDAPMPPSRRKSPPGVPTPFANASASTRGYGSGPGGPAGGYGSYAPGTASLGASYSQPIDNGYGRAPTSSTPNFNQVHDLPPPPPPAQQYDDPAHSPSPPRAASVAANAQAQLPLSSGQQIGPRRDRDRAVSERSDHRDRDRIDRAGERERDATPPNRTGSANKPSSVHHHYGRR